jgi:hypothetical protein
LAASTPRVLLLKGTFSISVGSISATIYRSNVGSGIQPQNLAFDGKYRWHSTLIFERDEESEMD